MALRAGKLLGKAVFYFNEGRGLVSLAVSLCNTVGIWYALLGFSRLMADVLLFEKGKEGEVLLHFGGKDYGAILQALGR